ncbi:MAG TPA: response regulator transcription factor [Candidatus Limnocylindrales bacterium]|nr:response regulator transcription factor [Candidatus Limnocylindrales bacterium]
MKPRVLIAEDDFLILEGSLRPALCRHFEVVAIAGDGEEAVAKAKQLRPDVVLLDISLPKLSGFDAGRQILAAQPGCKVLFVSNYWDPAYIQAAREMGAGGYVFKSRIVTELTSAIQTALAGGFYEPAV